jgi:hypothetical protein
VQAAFWTFFNCAAFLLILVAATLMGHSKRPQSMAAMKWLT